MHYEGLIPLMSEICQLIAFILLLNISTNTSSYSLLSLEDMITGSIYSSLRKVYLKYWGKGFKSNFSGFIVEGGVGSVFGNFICGIWVWCLRCNSSWNDCTYKHFSIFSFSIDFANLLRWNSLTHSSTTSTHI